MGDLGPTATKLHGRHFFGRRTCTPYSVHDREAVVTRVGLRIHSSDELNQAIRDHVELHMISTPPMTCGCDVPTPQASLTGQKTHVIRWPSVSSL